MGCSHAHIYLGPADADPVSSSDERASGAASNALPPSAPRAADPTPLPPPPPIPARSNAIAEHLAQVNTLNTPPPAISGGTLAVMADGSRVVAADSDRDAVHVITRDADGLSTARVDLPEGSEPGRVVLDPSRNAHVVLRAARAIAQIDVDNVKLVRITEVCALPRGVDYDATRDLVWVACMSGELVALDASTQAERSRHQLDLDLRDVIVDSNGSLFVSRYRSPELLAVAGDGTIKRREAPSSTAHASVSTPIDGFGVSEVTTQFATSPTLAWRTIRTANGEMWMLHERAHDEPVEIASGYGSGCSAIVRPQLTRYDAQGFLIASAPLDVDTTLAVDVAVSANMRWVAVANPAAYPAAVPSLTRIPADWLLKDAMAQSDPSEPAALAECVCPKCEQGLDNLQVTAVAFDAADRLYAFAREPAALVVYGSPTPQEFPGRLQPADSISLDERSAFDTAHALFHADVGNGLACASCHGEATDDAHVWNFVDVGPRRTQSMRGGLLETAPFHWQGDEPSFDALVSDVLTRRMGGPMLSPMVMDAMGHWIDQLPAWRLEAGDAQRIARGRALFESSELGCAQCHSGAALTNNATLDVGTGGEFQVPSLRGLALRAPFMHDGCAKTLEQRFDPDCGGDRHGHTEQLGSEARADLIAYLSSL